MKYMALCIAEMRADGDNSHRYLRAEESDDIISHGARKDVQPLCEKISRDLQKRTPPKRPSQVILYYSGESMPTAKQSRTRKQHIKERAILRRVQLWPNIPTEKNWDRKVSDGFATIPRTLALVGMIADTLADKNKRVSSTYWGLWCRVWDTGVVIIENEYELATEAGFTGERRVYTWRDRIKQLIKLNFIEVKEGPKGPYQYALIFNPYHVLCDHRENGNIQYQSWFSFLERSEEISAKDIKKYMPALVGEGNENG